MYRDETIAAVSTPAGEGGIGIVRVSGPGAPSMAERLIRKGKSGGWDSHRFYYGATVDPESGEPIDEVLAVLMRAPRSYTREDVLEIHCHGGTVAVRRILEAVLRCGARSAEPGEFTRRAFLNGRIDLLQAEAVIDVIRSRTDKSLAIAQSRRDGGLSRMLAAVRGDLVEALTLLEAYLDFPDDEIDGLSRERIVDAVASARHRLQELVAGFDSGRVYRDGVSVVIAGKPNVGKSSLLNALLREQRAIVTSVPGTTRDVVEEVVSIEGLPVRLSDTAGLRATDDEVEQIGVDLARQTLRTADLVLFVIDGSGPFEAEDREILSELHGLPCLPVVNKSDLPRVAELPSELPASPVVLSTRSGHGLQELRSRIVGEFVSGAALDSRNLALVADVRQRDALREAASALSAFLASAAAETPPDLLAADLHEALHRIGLVTGETTPDEILDRIFARFCVGK